MNILFYLFLLMIIFYIIAKRYKIRKLLLLLKLVARIFVYLIIALACGLTGSAIYEICVPTENGLPIPFNSPMLLTPFGLVIFFAAILGLVIIGIDIYLYFSKKRDTHNEKQI